MKDVPLDSSFLPSNPCYQDQINVYKNVRMRDLAQLAPSSPHTRVLSCRERSELKRRERLRALHVWARQGATVRSARRALDTLKDRPSRGEITGVKCQSPGPSFIILQISGFFLGFKETCNSLVDRFPTKRPSVINSFAIFLASPI